MKGEESMTEPRFVYVVWGFGEPTVFATLKAARAWRRKFATKCEITKAAVIPESAVDAAIAIAEKES
jgi:hypothetical protein